VGYLPPRNLIISLQRDYPEINWDQLYSGADSDIEFFVDREDLHEWFFDEDVPRLTLLAECIMLIRKLQSALNIDFGNKFSILLNELNIANAKSSEVPCFITLVKDLKDCI